MEELNYKELLKKYMDHVYYCEGSDFTSKLNHNCSDVNFTEEEIKILKDL